jgi:hemolysin activation/secretion protein
MVYDVFWIVENVNSNNCNISFENAGHRSQGTWRMVFILYTRNWFLSYHAHELNISEIKEIG